MGRLIDIDKARKEYSNLTDLTMSDTTLLLTLFGVLDNAPTVQAIPKAEVRKLLRDTAEKVSDSILDIVKEEYIPKSQYENRLKADMVAMLDELDLELYEQYDDTDLIKVKYIRQAIQQKINKLKKGDSNEQKQNN